MEAELNGRLIKLDEDGELYWWFHRNSRNVLKNPRWIRFKQSLVKTKNKVYKTIMVMGRHFKVHRVVYFIHNPEWNILDISKANLIDHVDRNTFNNNIENLRVVTQQQNQFNQKAKHIHLTKANTYRAKVSCGEVTLGKVFKTEEEAINAVNEFKLKYHQF